MFTKFFYDLRAAGLKVTMSEFITLQEALDSFTKNGARASFEEAVKGCIREGMLADFVILGADPFAADTSLLQEIPVLQTFLQGRQVYSVAD